MKQTRLFYMLWLVGLLTAVLSTTTHLLAAEAEPMAITESSFGPTTAESASAAVTRAWQLASASDAYQYRTRLEQTTYPLPSLMNAGQPAQQETLGVEGAVQLTARNLTLKLWTDASFDPTSGMEIRVENGLAEGRVGSGPWQPIDNIGELFAPGGDPLGFLSAVKDVTPAGTEKRALGTTQLTYQRYTFTLNGPALARYLQQQMEASLRQQGQWIDGLQSNMATRYTHMEGVGTIWLTENGLPARLELDMTLPPHGENGRVQAQMVTDYFDFDSAQLAKATAPLFTAPLIWVQYRWQPFINTLLPALFFLLLTILLVWLCLHHWQSRRFYIVQVFLLITSMLFTPLLDGAKAHAFWTEQSQREAAIAAAQATPDTLAMAQAAQTETADPHQNPLTAPTTTINQVGETAVLATNNNTFPPQPPANDLTDTDGDGLTDEAELEYWGTCPSAASLDPVCDGVVDPTDSDGDGLKDGVEANTLNLSPIAWDSDGDIISDTLEVQGFFYNGKMWYLNSREADSNKDGLIDSAECPNWVQANGALYDPAAGCPDYDGDGIPDVWDDDNDNDGVVDSADISPTSRSTEIYNGSSQPFALNIDNLTVDQPLYLDLHLRPTNGAHLGLHGNILDWPVDTKGQIQRVLTTTFATTSNDTLRSNEANAAYGDVRLVPVMEMRIPYTAGHYGNLPLLPAYQGTTRTLGEPVENWLDTKKLTPYGISVRDAGDGSGDLFVYLPISLVLDDTGGGRSAFGVRMLYWPMQGDGQNQAIWGSDHEFRLSWMVQMIVDDCIATDATGNCTQYEETLDVIHVYDEDWYVTGLSLSEEQGTDILLLYEDPAQDSNLTQHDDLWSASYALGNSFLRGRDCDSFSGNICQGDGQRDVTLANMDASINSWSGGADVIETSPIFSYDHVDYVSHIMITETVGLLNTIFTPYATQTKPLIMFAREDTQRRLNINDGTMSSPMTVDMDETAVPLMTRASLSWGTYEYTNGQWQLVDNVRVLEELKTQLSQNSFFQPSDSSEDSQYEAEGKLLWAQLYYANLMQGQSNIVLVDNTLNFQPDDDAVLEILYEPSFGSGVLTGAAFVALEWVAAVKAATPSLKQIASGTFFTGFGSAADRPGMTQYFRSRLELSTLSNIFVVATGVIALTALAILLFSTNQALVRIAEIVLNVITLVTSFIAGINLALGFASAAVSFSHMAAVGRANQVMSGTTLIVGLAITWGLFVVQGLSSGLFNHPNSPEFQFTLAVTIASSLVTFIFFIIALIPIIGNFIVLAIWITDALLFLICDCKGIQARLTEEIANALYDLDMVITNLDSSDRLGLNFGDVVLADPQAGFVESNSFRIPMLITNTLEFNNEFSSDAAKKSVFRYFLQQEPTPPMVNLALGEMSDDWTTGSNIIDLEGLPFPLIQRFIQTTAMADMLGPDISFSQAGPGINRDFSDQLHLMESYLIPYKGCWKVGNQKVKCNTYGTNGVVPIEVGSYLVFDVLPDTLGGLVAMLGNGVDSDNDSIPVSADPYDFSWDKDGDGLSDVYELQNGYSASYADNDNDGLSDPVEVRRGLDPNDADADDDGLSDAQEWDGWRIAYDVDSNGNPLYTWVWSDPHNPDADGDGLDDREEFVYGLNPYQADGEDTILDTIQFETGTTRETAAPQLLLRFEEDANATTFIDSANENDNGVCQSNSCPQTAVLGRYGYGVELDGVDDLITMTHVIDPGAGDFSAALWFRLDDLAGGRPLLAQGGGGVWLQANADGYLNSYLDGTTQSISPTVTTNTWHHAALTYDGTIRLYLDGVLVATNPRSLSNVSGPHYIGANQHLSNFTAGLFDELILYDVALSDADVVKVMNGRYNIDDRIVLPGDTVQTSLTISNTSLVWPAQATAYSQTDDGYNSYVEIEPYALWRFDESGGSTTFAADYFGGVATCNNGSQCPQAGVTGVDGSAVRFEGSYSFLNMDYVLNSWVNNSTNGFTMGGWFKPESGGPADQSVMALLTPTGSGSGAVRERVSFDPTDPYGNPLKINGGNPDYPLNANQWHHIMLSIDTVSKSRFLYVNGELVSTGYFGPISNKPMGGPTNNGRLRLSGPTWATEGYGRFKGLVDNFVIYDRLLTEAEVQKVLANEPILRPVEEPPTTFSIPIQSSATTMESLTIPDNHPTGNFRWFQLTEAALNIDDPYRVTADPIVRLHFDEKQLPWSGGTTTWEMGAYARDDVPNATQFVRCTTDCPLADGIAGKALALAGSDQWVRVISPNMGNAGWTVGAWIYPTHSDNSDRAIFGSRNGPSRPALFMTSSDQLGFAFFDGSSWETGYTPGGTIPRNQWSHVAVTYDGSGNYQAYLNGVPVGDDTAIAGQTPTLSGDYYLGHIGTEYTPFAGRIDNFTIYTVPFNDDEVAALSSLTDLSLHLHYTFDEPPGSNTTADISGIYGDGSCVNCPILGIRGVANRTAYFDGSNRVDTPVVPKYWDAQGVAEDYTLTAWTKIQQGRIFVQDNAWRPFRVWNDRLDTGWDYNSNFFADSAPFSPLPTDEWAFLAISRDADGTDNGIYINGEYISDYGLNPFEADGNVGQPSLVGELMVGYLDDLRLYNRPFVVTDVVTLMDTSVPQLQMEFEENSLATTFTDVSVNQHVGVFTNTVPGLNGRVGYGATFLGDGFINMGVVPGAGDRTNDFTVMAWIRPNNLATDQVIVGTARTVTAGNGWDLRVQTDGSLKLETHGVGNNITTPANVITPGRWQHVAVVVDQANNVTFYVDGDRVNTHLSVAQANSNNDDDLLIGGAIWQAGLLRDAFNGGIDELSIYSRAWSAAEIDSGYLSQFRWFRRQQTTYLTVDNDMPTITLYTDNSYWANAYTQLVVGTIDPTSGIGSFEFGLKAPSESSFTWQSAPLCADAKRNALWCPFFNPTQLGGEGLYQVQFRVVDGVGNETVSVIYDLLVDGTPPVVSSSYSGDWLEADAAAETDLRWTIPLAGSVNDPLIGAMPGSGVNITNVLVSLVDNTGAILGGKSQTAVVAGTTWSIDYRVDGQRPSGNYDIIVTATDNVGNESIGAATLVPNASNTIGSIKLDEHPPTVHLDASSLPTDVITQPITLTGFMLEQPDWGAQLATFHFEEANGSTTFTDASGQRNDAACVSCPQAGQAGLFGNALQFDGVDDYLTLPTLLNPISYTFSAAVWFNVDSLGGTHTFIQQADGNGMGRTWLSVIGDGRLQSYIGGNPVQGTTSISPGTWHHAGVTYDGTYLRLYLDGKLEAETPVTPEFSDGDMLIGLHKELVINPMAGRLDEIQIWRRALSSQELYALGKKEVAGVGQAYVALTPAFATMPEPLVYLPLGDAPDRDSLADISGNGFHFICNVNRCPAADQSGARGTGLTFNQDNRWVYTPNQPDLNFAADQDFTMALWVRFDQSALAGQYEGILINKLDPSGTESWAYMLAYNGPNEFDPGMIRGHLYTPGQNIQINSNARLTDSEFHHLLFMRRDKMLYLYIDGQLDATIPDTTTEPLSNTQPVRLGLYGSSFNFRGDMDEFYIFDQALTEDEIDILATPPTDLPVMANRGALASNWQYSLPTGLEDYYQIDIWGHDVVSNSSRVQTVWRGTIDMIAPRITGTAQYLGSGAAAQTAVSFIIDDLTLQSDTLIQPCLNEAWQETYHPNVNELMTVTATCYLPGHQSGPLELTACDGFGRCTTLNLVPQTNSPIDSVAILTPTIPLINRTNGTTVDFTIGGYDVDGITQLELYVNGQLVDSTIIASNPTNTTWATSWTPVITGTYVITAVITDALSNSITSNSRQVVVWEPIGPINLSIAALSATDAELSWSPPHPDCQADVHEATTPYFSLTTPFEARATTPYELVGRLGEVGTNYFYALEMHCFGETAVSNFVGEFDFAITSGN
ncbi:MAG TPA: LamG-like jellyroll fold domain-containing protein [Anaerolineae bacterium]|nr:LamG-like jellyroll fold domain-containing protein [Anaerolineae bacterium]